MDSSSGGGGVGIIGIILYLAVVAFLIASMWKMYAKAGQPGWAAIVPIYNFIIMLKIVGKPMWWIVLFLIPFVNFVALILIAVALAKSFGKTGGFAAGLILLPFVFYPILGFGSAQYQGPQPAAA